jgi:pectate lyase
MLSLNAIPALLALAGAFVSQASAECNASVHKLEGYGSGTTGGGNAAPVDVRSCAELEAATASKGSVIRVFGQLRGCGVIDLKDDTTLIGGDYQACE